MKHSILFLSLIFAFIACKEKSATELNKSPFSVADTALVLIQDEIPDIKTDVRYATTNNFTGKILYPSDKVYFRKCALDSLAKVQAELCAKGLSLKVYDAYRPLSVQKIMWGNTS